MCSWNGVQDEELINVIAIYTTKAKFAKLISFWRKRSTKTSKLYTLNKENTHQYTKKIEKKIYIYILH